MSITITARRVGGFRLDSIPAPDETIYDDFDIKIEDIKELMAYKREKIDCPNNEGNWMIDIRWHDGSMTYHKLPLEMTSEQITAYCKPLFDDLDAYKKSKMQ